MIDLTTQQPDPKTPEPSKRDNRTDVPDEWGRQSFPASDPPQNW